MGHRFHLPVIQQESGLHQGFPVSGGAGTDNLRPFGKLRINVLYGAYGGFQRTAVIIAVEGIKKGAVLAYKRHLGGGAARINPQIAVACIILQRSRRYAMAVMAGAEGFVFLIGREKRLHTGYLEFHFNAAGQLPDHLLQRKIYFFLSVQR